MKNTFQGSFCFTRFVSLPELTIAGTAIFINAKNTVYYKENGFYTLNNEEHQCYQQQIFLFTENRLIIQNNMGQTLHNFNLNKDDTYLQDTHICKNDSYAIDIKVQSNDNFITSYQVKGPKKNYRMITTYKRISHNKL